MTELEQTKQALADRTAELEQVKRVANELTSQNEVLCSAIEDVLYGGEQVGNLAGLLNKIPPQCLAEVRAQAVEVDACEWLHNNYPQLSDPVCGLLTARANQLRQQAKP